MTERNGLDLFMCIILLCDAFKFRYHVLDEVSYTTMYYCLSALFPALFNAVKRCYFCRR